MPNIANPPPYKETIEFLRNAKPPGEYTRMEIEKRKQKPALLGSPEWVEAVRNGAFAKRPPVPAEPQRPVAKPAPVTPNGLARYVGKPCPYCNYAMAFGTIRRPTREHIVPRSKGGRLNGANMLIVCSICNHNKSDMSLEQFAEWLRARRDPRAEIVENLLSRFQPNDSFRRPRRMMIPDDPKGSGLHDRQTAILQWLESRGHRVIY